MIQFVENALKSPAGSFGFVFAILMLAFWCVHYVSKWSTKLGSVDKLNTDLSGIKDDISIIKGFITVFREANNPFAKSQSPLSLTEIGKNVSVAIKAKDLVSLHWDEIEKDFQGLLNKDCNPYDIQQSAISFSGKIFNYFTKSELNEMKLYAFREGHSLINYELLFAVHIRDIYFDKHGIHVSEVDKFDPTKTNPSTT